MSNKFLITILCISSLAYCRDYNKDLRIASMKGDLDQIIEALKMGADINSKSEWSGETALHLASTFGKQDIVNFLLEKGANVNNKDILQHTPLYTAIKSLRPEVVKILLSDPNIVVDKSYLELINETSLRYKKGIADYLAQGREQIAKGITKDKLTLNEIERILIEYLDSHPSQSK